MIGFMAAKPLAFPTVFVTVSSRLYDVPLGIVSVALTL